MIKALQAITIIAASTLCLNAYAVELGDLRINGFISQGYMKSSDNDFLIKDSQDGSFEINEIGLTFTMPVSNKLRLGAQFLSSDLGSDGNNEVTLDWAFADYKFNDNIGVRAGKIKLPVGLYNETRDSDFVRPMAFLPQSVYDEMQRSFTVAATGIGAYGNLSLGGLGDLDYQLFYGQLQIDEDRLLIDNGIRAGMDQIVSGVGSAFGAPVNATGIEYRPDETIAASLVLNTAIDGLRLGVSYLRTTGEFDVDIQDNFGVFTGFVNDFSISANYNYFYVGSIEYTRGIVTVAAEYMQREHDVVAEGLKPLEPFIGTQYNFLTNTVEGMYVQATVMIPQVEGLSVSVLYDQFYNDKDNHSGSERRDIGLGIRYDINANWLVKAEYHDIQGTALNLGMVNDGAALSNDWSYVAFKTSYIF